jgi:SAM-dependent methyltransferase
MTTSTPSTPASIEIRPEVTMLSVLRHLNYKPWFAIAEFIDNALQSYLINKGQLEDLHGGKFQLCVNVQIDTSEPGRILISDNAAGISLDDFPRAFRAAQAPSDRTGLSEFGMGMKSAACWFAQKWSVRTKAIGEDVERTIAFDIRDIVENKIESLDVAESPMGAREHYTVVSLHGLHHVPHGRTIGKIKEHLASIYRIFLRDGSLVLTLNGEHLSHEPAKFLNVVPFTSPGVPAHGPNVAAVEWRKDISFDFGGGQHVKGFVGLRETGSTLYAGLALFRRRRLIEGSYDDTYRPSVIFKQTNSYAYQRVFGELHIEGFEVSHTKDGFQWEEYEEVFLECLKEVLEEAPLNLLAQAENYRALPSRRNVEAKAEAATSAVAKHLETEVAPLLVNAQHNPTEPASVPAALARSSLQASERTVEINDGSYTWLITLRTSVDPVREDWLSLAKQDSSGEEDGENRRMFVDLSLAHPFSAEFIGTNYENVELFLRIATAVSIALVLSEDMSGQNPDTVLHHFNLLMRGALIRASLNTDANTN